MKRTPHEPEFEYTIFMMILYHEKKYASEARPYILQLLFQSQITLDVSSLTERTSIYCAHGMCREILSVSQKRYQVRSWFQLYLPQYFLSCVRQRLFHILKTEKLCWRLPERWLWMWVKDFPSSYRSVRERYASENSWSSWMCLNLKLGG